MKIVMIKKIIYISLIWMVFHGASLHAASLLVEAESFTEKGGWVVDQQFMDLMGSPYLLAHGLGSPVENASTNVQLPENGTYYIFVRTYNWTSPWQEGEGIVRFVSKRKENLLPVGYYRQSVDMAVCRAISGNRKEYSHCFA